MLVLDVLADLCTTLRRKGSISSEIRIPKLVWMALRSAAVGNNVVSSKAEKSGRLGSSSKPGVNNL